MNIKTWQERYNNACIDPTVGNMSAIELISRAKQAEIDELRAKLAKLEGQEPYAWCIADEISADWCFSATECGVENNALLMDVDCIKTQPFPLYIAAGATQGEVK